MKKMLFLISIALSANSALAAQMETFKSKDTNSINSNANAIFSEIGSENGDSLRNAKTYGQGNAAIFSNANNRNPNIRNYDSPRGIVSVVTNKGETTTSFLLSKSAWPLDSGHYQCNPSNAKPKSVTVHVLNAMHFAALVHHQMSPSHYILVYLLMYLFNLSFARRFIRQPAVVDGVKVVVM